MITAAQLRAARGLLDWSRGDLAKASNVSQETIKNIEHGIFRPQETTETSLIKAFASHDVTFTEDEGVRFDRNNIKQYAGHEDFKKFMDDVYQTALNDPEAEEGGCRPICVSNVDDRLFVEHLGEEYAHLHVLRMGKLKDVKLRVLVRENDFYSVPDTKHIEYRWNKNQSNGDVPFYVYGHKFAILMFNQKPAPRIIVIRSELLSGAYREQFDVLWKNSTKRDDVKK